MTFFTHDADMEMFIFSNEDAENLRTYLLLAGFYINDNYGMNLINAKELSRFFQTKNW